MFHASQRTQLLGLVRMVRQRHRSSHGRNRQAPFYPSKTKPLRCRQRPRRSIPLLGSVRSLPFQFSNTSSIQSLYSAATKAITIKIVDDDEDDDQNEVCTCIQYAVITLPAHCMIRIHQGPRSSNSNELKQVSSRIEDQYRAPQSLGHLPQTQMLTHAPL